jgi:hypothetical protein
MVQNHVNQVPAPVFETAEASGVPGLQFFPAFVSEKEEADLLSGVAACTWHSLAKREVCHFGYEFDYLVRFQPHLTTVAARARGTGGCTFWGNLRSTVW